MRKVVTLAVTIAVISFFVILFCAILIADNRAEAEKKLIIPIDGCEYLLVQTADGWVITHRENCPNPGCKRRLYFEKRL